MIIPQNDNPGNITYIVILPLVLCGFSYCFYSAGLWPSIPYAVDKDLLGSAFGITTSIQNVGLALGPVIASAIVNRNKSGGNYRMLNLVQIVEAGIGLSFGIVFWIYTGRKKESSVLLENKIEEANKED
eukprot:TRINITY_DN2139_c0_g1_i6.p1 TRINITY_DN2139_c0_g1~~TRINITY_DN2139_c0_g1_i6.p1  ORF type:complete len:129 (-),score=22.52 TRINITY_DN2139_c0_g1_i6:156-542(-)